MIRLALIFTILSYSAAAIPQDYITWNGGITIAERNNAPSNGTRLVFFVSGGNFLSDVHVTLVDAENSQIVDTRTKGPWLILNLPAGTYTVKAERNNGDEQSIEIAISQNDNREFGIMFPDS